MDEEVKKWATDAIERNHDNIKKSEVFLALWSPACTKDVSMILQVGLAVMLDKPLFIICIKDTPIPQNLRKIAHSVEHVETIEESAAAATRIMQMVEDLGIIKRGEVQ